MLTRIFHLNALSALHVGIGQAIGVVDLPIARAKATNLPIVPGSALKGVLRDEFSSDENQTTLFGPGNISDYNAHASALAFGDAHLLLLPARSLAGVVAFVTCPFVLARYAADLQRADVANIPAMPGNVQGAQACSDTKIKANGNTVVLEDLDLPASNGADKWADFIAQQLYGTAEKDKHWVSLPLFPMMISLSLPIPPQKFVHAFVSTMNGVSCKKARCGTKKICLPKVCCGV
jgi:CRISPR-associated protein Cmr4